MKNTLIFILDLIKEGLLIQELGESRRSSTEFDRRFTRLCKNSTRIFSYLELDDYLREATRILEANMNDLTKTTRLTGLLESAYDQLNGGFVGRLKHVLHAEMYSSVVDQARALNEAGFSVPAAVLGRIAVEGWLRDLAEQKELELPEGCKAATINDALLKTHVFSKPKWRQVQSMLDIGNAAAHGDESGCSHSDVLRLLEFVEVNVSEVPMGSSAATGS